MIDYAGETGVSFWQRMKDHLIQELGGNYRVCDPESLIRGEEKKIWNGLWWKETRDKINEFIGYYSELAPIIKKYIGIHDVFIAPISTNQRTQKRIEGNIATYFKTRSANMQSTTK